MRLILTILLSLLTSVACDDGDDPTDGDGDADADADHDDADTSTGDADDDDLDADDETADADVPVTFCDIQDLSTRPWNDGEEFTELRAVAADFTVPTRGGDWNFRENWSGCETYLFISDAPAQNMGWPGSIWDRDFHALFARLPVNTHLFFASTAFSQAERDADLDALQIMLDGALSHLDEPEQSQRWERVHLVTDAATSLDGWLGDVMTRPGWGVGIDRFQRIRYVGSYAHYARYDSAREWFGPNLAMVANEAVYYNFEAERADRLDAHETTVVELFDGEVLADPGWAGTRGQVDIELPDAATIATFDTLELDLFLGCDGEGEYGTCPAWDYIVHLYLCDAGDPDSCDTEFGRWITTYHREGRWVHDVSGLLPLIAEGGTRRFGFYTQQPYVVHLDLRFSNRGRDARPVVAEYLYTGGGFGPDYNDRYEPTVLTLPAGAERVELATVISGHGMHEPGNCAEFCNTTHHFFVNGEENIIQHPEAGTDEGCMDQVAQGTVPNQYGTWWFGRNGWCPGLEVPMIVTDITSQVELGAENTFDYEGYFRGSPYPSGGPNIVMRSWVVVWE